MINENEIFGELSKLRGALAPSEYILGLLVELAHKKTGMSREELPISYGLHARSDLKQVTGSLSRVAALLSDLSEGELLEFLDKLFGMLGSRGEPFWTRLDASRKIAQFAEGAQDVRCAFGPALFPTLIIAMNRADRKARFVSVHRPEIEIARLANLIFDLQLDILEQDPFLREDGQPAQFELSMPPFGLLYSDLKGVPGQITRRLGLDKVKARVTAEVLAIEDALEYPARRQLVLVAPGTLFRNVGVERIARSNLLFSGRLRSVLRIPSGMAFEATAIPSSLLVIDDEPRSNEVSSLIRFLDLQNPRFSCPRERGRHEVRPEVSWRDAVEASGVSGDSWARDVSIAEIEERGGVLTPDRFFAADAEDEVAKLCAGMDTFALSDLAEVIRPAPLLKDEAGDILAREAAAAEIDEDGYLLPPSKVSRMTLAGLSKASDQRLVAGDVVLAVKGTIGAVGLVPEEVSAVVDEVWVPGQSLVALRLRKGVPLSPVTFFEFLSSQVMRDYLKSLAAGTAVQTLSIKDVKSLRIPVPAATIQEKTEECFRARQEIHRKIKELRKAVENARNAWPHRI
ncbi:N-6 DNA methylase [Cereibacter azotoformans]|uniref:N-6 DNA methylase n=1 Tax=Cereibacter azotoformans TaxID=43057 RepID=UPI000E35F99E|nr:N-6 DNA methylase [Cereibacter azotoformans]AXQ95506.1 hypothetical protein D0Z66_17160 [Cereibacter sphaeroides]UIJ32251.1 N-6 DNA methylase [Cereibacter azotoformans]